MPDELDDLEVETIDDDNQIQEPDEVTPDAAADDEQPDGEAPAAQDEPIDGSLTVENEDPPPAQEDEAPVSTESSPAPPAEDLESIKGRAAAFQTKYQESLEKLKRYEGIDPADVQAFRQHQRQLQTESLPAHNRYSPKYQEFQKASNRAREIAGRVQSIRQAVNLPDGDDRQLTPQQAEALIAQEHSLLGDDDRQMLEAQHQHQQVVNEALYSNPDVMHMLNDPMGFIGWVAQQSFQQAQKQQQAASEVDSWFESNQQLVDKYGAQIASDLERGNEWALVKARYEALAQVEGLQSQQAELSRTASAAKARDEARKQDATLAIDPASGGGKRSLEEELARRRAAGDMIDELDLIAEMDSQNAFN